jgi:hypothetical protein
MDPNLAFPKQFDLDNDALNAAFCKYTAFQCVPAVLIVNILNCLKQCFGSGSAFDLTVLYPNPYWECGYECGGKESRRIIMRHLKN